MSVSYLIMQCKPYILLSSHLKDRKLLVQYVDFNKTLTCRYCVYTPCMHSLNQQFGNITCRVAKYYPRRTYEASKTLVGSFRVFM